MISSDINCGNIKLKIQNLEELTELEIDHLKSCQQCAPIYEKIENDIKTSAAKTITAASLKYNLKSINKKRDNYQYSYLMATSILIITTVSLLIYFSLNYYYLNINISKDFTAKTIDFDKNIEKNIKMINEKTSEKFADNYDSYISNLEKSFILENDSNYKKETYENELFFSFESATQAAGESCDTASEPAIITGATIKTDNYTLNDSTELTYAENYFNKYDQLLSENKNNSILLAEDSFETTDIFTDENNFYETKNIR